MERDGRLRIDPIRCHAHGLCAELLPELIRLDEWGYPIIEDPLVPPAMRRSARAAVTACPTLALRLEDAHRSARGSGSSRTSARPPGAPRWR